MNRTKSKKTFSRFWVGALLGATLGLGSHGCVVMDQRSPQQLEATFGANKPKIEATFASQWLSPREIWKIYLNGSDPDRDIRWIQVSLWVPGGIMHTARLHVEAQQEGRISGYLTLHTMDLPDSLLRFGNSDLRLYLALEDKAGHVSERAVLSVSLVLGSRQEMPKPGLFQETFLGEVPVRFLQLSPSAGLGTWP
ncbi:MAG: hypothetical protein WHX93_02780 [bacterium]